MTDHATLPAALAAGSSAPVSFHGARGTLVHRTTWRDLDDHTTTLARRLLSIGLAAGERVGVMAETDSAFVALFLALQKAGLVPVPLPLPNAFGDRTLHASRLDGMLRAAGSRVAFAAAPYTHLLPDWLGIRGTPEELDTLPQSSRPLPPVGPDDTAFLQFSSGSTRFPKGVVVRQRAVIANARAIARALHTGAGDCCVSWLPLYHDMGLVGCVLAPLVAGMRLHLLPTREFVRNPLVWLRLMAECGGTVSYSPAFGYELAARRATPDLLAGLDLSRWRVAGIGGDMVRPEVLAGFARAFRPAGFSSGALVPSYGLAEATLAVTMAVPGDGVMTEMVDLDLLERHGVAAPPRGERARAFARCGKPLPGTRVAVRDAHGRDLPEGRVGRVQVQGEAVMAAYFREPEETARVLDAAGWLDTGDLGYMTDGELVVTGRAKDIIIINGRNLWPQDLEWAAERVAPLRSGDVAAIGHDGSDGLEQVVLLVQCRVPDAPQRDRLVEAVVASVMAASGVLCRVVLVPPHTLPRTSSGKLARAHARRLLSDGVFG